MSRGTLSVSVVCPAPPVDFAARKLPVRQLDLLRAPLRRIHRTVRDPVHFNKAGVTGSRFRFDAPNDEYGTLYASQFFDACAAETLVRDRFVGMAVPLVLAEDILAARSVSVLMADPPVLRLADLTGTILHLGGTGEVLTHPDYAMPNLWSRAIQSHPDRVDGVIFRSRYASAESVAIFDRVKITQVGAALQLLSSAEMAAYLARYHIGLI